MAHFKIVETDNFCRPYPGEKFVNLPPLTREQAEAIAKIINHSVAQPHDRYWKVVDDSYKLAPEL